MHSRVRTCNIWIAFWIIFTIWGIAIDVDIVAATGIICCTIWQAKKS